MILLNILDHIGNTPMVRINNLIPKRNVQLYAKLERFNPGGSVKDRIAKYMIEYAERDGTLTKDKIVIEPTSGNTGIGLALVCAVKGYKLVLVMPETMTMERRKMMMAYGAKIVLSEGCKGMDGAEDLAKEIVAKNPEKYFMPNQFSNKYNVLAHYETTGPEIWRDTEGKVTHFVAGIGTTGTLMGVSKYLKERNPRIRIVAVEPDPKTSIQGLKNLEVQYVPKIWNNSMIDEKHTVTLDEAEEMARLLALSEGIFCGPSSGAIMRIAMKVANDIDEGVVVAILPDGGEKYLSTQLCDPQKCLECAQKYQIPCAYADKDLNF
ncbi:MAG: PLP-dependent cysteine synthase family protein [Thermoproteota archaeon]